MTEPHERVIFLNIGWFYIIISLLIGMIDISSSLRCYFSQYWEFLYYYTFILSLQNVQKGFL